MQLFGFIPYFIISYYFKFIKYLTRFIVNIFNIFPKVSFKGFKLSSIRRAIQYYINYSRFFINISNIKKFPIPINYLSGKDNTKGLTLYKDPTKSTSVLRGK